jgi:hypothetical protein
MGIKYLNSFIKDNTGKNSIHKINLSLLSGKIIAVDTSIYLYKFLGEEALLENMFIMISLFRYYNITPIFVLDGKTPIEKAELIKKRCNDKNMAEEQYNLIKQDYDYTDSVKKKNELYKTMQLLKKKFLRLYRSDYIKVLELMDAYGVKYIEAPDEADILCAKLVIKKAAYACLSEDMDMFVYGCPRVLRYLSLVNKTVVLYDYKNILLDLNLTSNEFKEICVLSGTDYNNINNNNINNNNINNNNINNNNINNNNINSVENTEANFHTIFQYFKLYKNSNDYTKMDFYTWLDTNYNFIENIYKLYDICNMFLTKNITLKDITIKPKTNIDFEKIKQILKPEGFIFL